MLKKVFSVVIVFIFLISIASICESDREFVGVTRELDFKQAVPVTQTASIAQAMYKTRQGVLQLPKVSVSGEYQEVSEPVIPVSEPLVQSPTVKLSTDVVDSTEIKALGAKNVIDAVFFRPNITINYQGRKSKKSINVRGEKATILVNGVSQGNDQRSMYTLPADDIEKIDVIKDSSSLIYGEGGIGGVINIKSKPLTNETVLKIEGGTFSTSKILFRFNQKKGDFGYGIDLNRDYTEGPSGKGAKEELNNIKLKLQKNLDSKGTYLHFNLNSDNNYIELPIQELDTTGFTKQELASLKLTPGWKFDPWKTVLSNLEYHKVWKKTASTNFNIFLNKRDSTNIMPPKTGSRSIDKTTGINLRHTVSSLEKDITVRLGTQYEHWECPTGKLYYVGKGGCEKEHYAIFMQGEKILKNGISIDGGLRQDTTNIIKDTAYWGKNGEIITNQKEQPLYSYSYGILKKWNPEFETSLRIGTGNKIPRNKYANLTGDELSVEKQKQYNLVFSYQPFKNDSISAGLSLFKINQDDALISDGLITVDIDEYINVYKNADIKSDGFEFTFSKKVSRWLKLSCGYGKRSYKSDDDPAIQDHFPEYNYNFGLRYNKKDLSCNLSGKYVSGYKGTSFLPQGKSLDIGNYLRLDGSIYYKLRNSSSRQDTVFLIVNNITDERYQTISTYPDFGRKISAGYELRWK